jgi:hypothetical protein
MYRKIMINSKWGIGPVDPKYIKNNFSNIRIIWEDHPRLGKKAVGFKGSGETYEYVHFNKFVFCGTFLGLAAAMLKGDDNVQIPLELIWELREYVVKNFIAADHVLWKSAVLTINKAFELLGYEADVSSHEGHIIIGDQVTAIAGYDVSRMGGKCIGFDLNGVKPEKFFAILILSMYWSFEFGCADDGLSVAATAALGGVAAADLQNTVSGIKVLN